MSDYNNIHLRNIKTMFESKTEVHLPVKKSLPRSLRVAAILAAAMVCCLCAAAFTAPLFAFPDSDELTLGSAYDGGTVTVFLENRSDTPLNITAYKLMRWNTGEVILTSEEYPFDGGEVPAESAGELVIDLSASAEALEAPLPDGDHYYLVLTNNRFVFGHDFLCSVDFTPSSVQTADTESPIPTPEIDSKIPQSTAESLRFYFEADTRDPAVRREMTAAYAEAYAAYIAESGAEVVPSVSPVLPGNRIDPDVPRLSLKNPGAGVIFDEAYAGDQVQLVTVNWFSMDTNFKLIAGEGEYAMTVSAGLPSKKYGDNAIAIPLLYVLTYEKAAVRQESCAFIYGQLIPFAALAPYAVYEDDTYICYEVSAFLYTDLASYAGNYAAQNADIHYDADAQARIDAIHHYYKEHLSDLLYFETEI